MTGRATPKEPMPQPSSDGFAETPSSGSSIPRDHRGSSLSYRRASPPPPAVVDAVLRALEAGEVTTKEELHSLKLSLARSLSLPKVPSDADLLAGLAPAEAEKWRPLLALKATRTLSGVAIVTVQSSPEACPHGRCIYCPGGPSEGSAQAYTGFEPAALRAKANGFDPYRQTASRLAQLRTTGHDTDKVDLIIQGGTFTARDLDYQQWFVKRCLDAMNEVEAAAWGAQAGGAGPLASEGGTLPRRAEAAMGAPRGNGPAAEAVTPAEARAPKAPAAVDGARVRPAGADPDPVAAKRGARRGHDEAAANGARLNRYGSPGALTLDEALRLNQTAASRMIGLTIETKPDWFLREHVDAALAYGATRVELGIQTVHEEVQRRTNRGHGIRESIEATRRAKDAGLKVCYHMMPGLPGSTPEMDRESFRRIFSDPDFRPDMVKIYPTLVMPRTPLHAMWRKGLYEPLSTNGAARIIADAKEMLPPWVRIQRVDRDIPVPLIGAGVDKSNLRQLAVAELARRGKRCGCVRCREVGHHRRAHGEPEGAEPEAGEETLVGHRYAASSGIERFLGLDDPRDGALLGYLRLRILHEPWREGTAAGDAMIRELKVPGAVVPLGEHRAERNQHKGRGARLLAEAARVAREEGAKRLFVLAGTGVKPYYRKMGFRDTGVYQVMHLP